MDPVPAGTHTLGPEGVLEHILWATRARPSGPGRWVGHCPAHEDRSPSLSIRETHEGAILLYCFAGCETEAILAALGLEWRDLFPESSDWSPERWSRAFPRLEAPPTPDEARRKALERLWAEAAPLTSPRAEVGRRYLEARGLDLEAVLPGLQNLRVHPGLEYREEGKVVGTFPALLARVEHPQHGLVALHRTYLAPDGKGKAPLASPKKLTKPVFDGATKGAAIRLYEAREEVALCEGVETALAVREVAGLPVWACVSAGGLEAALLPEGVRRVVIAPDHDGRGLEAARNLAKRLLEEGRQVFFAVPPVEGHDWLDYLNAEGAGEAPAPGKGLIGGLHETY